MAEDSLSTQLVLFRSTLKTKPPFLREEIKQEYYKWISATGIDVNNCPERLKHFLFGVNEIIEGKGEKILEDLRNEQANVNFTSPEFMEEMQKLFAYSHSESKKVEKVEKSLEGQTYRDIEVKSKFGSGDVENGQQTFNQLAGSVASRHDNFHFFPQKSSQISGYLTTDGAVINNEPYEEIPANSVQATPEQVEEVNREKQQLEQNNSNGMK